MAENSAISWTDHTFNPWWGFTKVGPGCDHCYAESFDKRVGGDHWGPSKPRRLVKDWSKPLKWNREAERTGVRPWVFCASMADVFDNEVPAKWRERLWALVRETPHLRWIFVTKRIGNVVKMLPPDWPGAFGHCGICITVVNQAEADRDVPKLLNTPAAWRGISAEPLLGPISFEEIGERRGHAYTDALTGVWFRPDDEARQVEKLDWIIVGGESGPNARPMHPAWARSIRDQCAAAGMSFHFKQWGEWGPSSHLEWEQDDKGHRHMLVSLDGRYGDTMADLLTAPRGTQMMRRLGKARAGRLLDGVEHNGMPSTPTPPPTPGRESRVG